MALTSIIRKALSKPSPAFGFWLTLPSTAIARTVLRSASNSPASPLSWVLIDGEHGLISEKDYYDLSATVASEGSSPIIRVPCAEEWMIKRALDSGAHGILTPMCHTAEDAARIVKYSKYPPAGSRGYGPSFAVHSFPSLAPGPTYEVNADKQLVVMVQIESQSGVDNVEKIAATEGLDILLIGPFDLAKQLNVTWGGPEHEAAIARVLKAAQDNSKKAAIFCTNGDQARVRIEQGFDMVSIATDATVLAEGMMRELGASQGLDGQRKETANPTY
ncbi:unnamed protein product [Parascedosporium putredinis]|uniref:HpcH/HpaI aldolase/citrate lyase domain-containing protein n=1 Tax=Parascedosporium putredinis TaxID=1442378 RepID=A0A9P1M6F4_9PEZI|nr:unnamed protein product [Parascedosporium putredinis]CAI7988345.1 unnamed protein product [Parascedosporium putredinis]